VREGKVATGIMTGAILALSRERGHGDRRDEQDEHAHGDEAARSVIHVSTLGMSRSRPR
jgi:L-fucose mutarotase/ribose pyranase (RbsD/FucU family)